MSSTPQRYYCHQCNATCVPEAPDFVCPTCHDGFIEPMRVAPLARPPPGMFPTLNEEPILGGAPSGRGAGDPMNVIMRHMLRAAQAYPPVPDGTSRPTGTNSTAAANGSSSSSQNGSSSSSQNGSPTPNNDSGPGRLGGHSHRMHSSNVGPNSAGMHFQGGTGRLRFVLGDGLHQNLDGNTDVPTLLSMIMSGLGGTTQVVGNPGDYAWGPTGLDNIISQLIGQLDGSGPPPAQEDSIDSLPDVYVPKKHIDNKLDCTVCQEYFVEDEKVKELPCSHYFHVDCIVPWLKLHNSCPICRTSIDQRAEGQADVSMSEDSLPELEEPGTQELSSAASQQQQQQQQPPQTQPIHEDDLD